MWKGVVAVVLTFAAASARGQSVKDPMPAPPDRKMAAAVMERWPAGVISTENKPGEWAYEEGVLLDGMAAEWHATADRAYFSYIQSAVDKYVAEDGTIRMSASGGAYPVAAHSLDNIELGRAVLLVYQETRGAKYAKVAKFLHQQLAAQPRTASGAYWHKQIYPNQVWLDGAYMAEVFRAQYAATFQEPRGLDDVAHQLLLMDTNMRDPVTGLLRHGWDESKSMPWADKQTGLSPAVWARSMGWYCMALVDVLDWLPQDHPQRTALVQAVKRTMAAVIATQDTETGLWWQVMDRGPADPAKPTRPAEKTDSKRQAAAPGNFLEASASAMFVYAIAKAVRMGYLDQSPYTASAQRGWDGIQKRFVKTGTDGLIALTGTVKVGGLGGTPYRSGTYEYYVSEKTIDNDAKGIGAFLMAGAEMQRASTTPGYPTAK